MQKVEGMYKDMDACKITMQQFKDNVGNWLDRQVVEDGDNIPVEALVPVPPGYEFDFDVSVLTSGNWPVMQEQACKLPKELQMYKVRFDHWYVREHGSRTLTWLYDNG